MGCDIHSFAERKNKKTGKWEQLKGIFTIGEFDKKLTGREKGDHPFDWRSYSMFAFLAGVRNYDHCEPVSEPKRLPNDLSDEVRAAYEQWGWDTHSKSYLTAKKLLAFDYGKKFWNRRVSKQISPNHWHGAALAEEGEGSIVSYRENLGEDFFVHLEELKICR